MAKNAPNLKVNVNSDTSGFTKGMASAKKELNAFEKTSSDAFGKIAGALGVNTDQVQKLQEAFAGAGRKISDMGGEGNKALGQIVASAGKAATAIGAIGIGAAVTAFKALNAEAEAFKNTVEGANIALQTQTYLDTYRQAMHDANAGIGQSIAEAEAKVEKGWGRIKQNISSTLAVSVGSTNKWYDAFLPTGIIRGASQVSEQSRAAKEAAEQAESAASILYNLQRQQSDNSRQWAETERQIAEYRRIASDQEESSLTRANAIARAKELTNQLYAEQYDIALMISNVTDLISAQAGDSIADAEAANKAEADALAIEQKRVDSLRTLDKLQATISKNAAAEAKARQEAAEAIAKGVERQQALATFGIEMAVSEESRNAIASKLEEVFATKPVEIPIKVNKWAADKEILNWTETIQQTLVEGAEGIADSFGTLVGNLLTGGGGFAEFGQDLLTMVGTFAQKFGKVLIAFGVASEAFKESLSSLNGIAAIAAGAALVAAGAAVKAAASNMASSIGGASAAGSYVASSSYGGGAAGYANSTLQVEVSGVLTANGSELVAVLNNENNRKHYKT